MSSFDYACFVFDGYDPTVPLGYNEASLPLRWALLPSPGQHVPFGLTLDQRDVWWNHFAAVEVDLTFVDPDFGSGTNFTFTVPRQIEANLTPHTVTEADLWLPGIDAVTAGNEGPTCFRGSLQRDDIFGPGSFARCTLTIRFFSAMTTGGDAVNGAYVDALGAWYPAIEIVGLVEYDDGLGNSYFYDFSTIIGAFASLGDVSFCPLHGGGDLPITITNTPQDPLDYSINGSVIPVSFYGWEGAFDTSTGEPL